MQMKALLITCVFHLAVKTLVMLRSGQHFNSNYHDKETYNKHKQMEHASMQCTAVVLYKTINMIISAVNMSFLWLSMYVVSGASGASLKWTLDQLQILALLHCLIFLEWRLSLGLNTV